MEFDNKKFALYERLLNSSSVVKLCKLNLQDSKKNTEGGDHAFDIASWKGYELKNNVLREIKCHNIEIEVFVQFENSTSQKFDQSTTSGYIPIAVDWNRMPSQDFKITNQNACQVLVNQWAQTCGIEDGSAYFNKMQQIIPIMCASNVPGINLMEMPVYLLGMFIIMMIDDTFDNKTDLRDIQVNLKGTHEAVGSFCSALLGELTIPIPTVQFPHYEPLFNLILELRRLLTSYGIDNCKHYIDAYIAYLTACGWETEGYSTDTEEDLNHIKSLYFDIRETTIAYIPCMELQIVLKKAYIPETVRRDPLLQLFNRQVSRHIVVVNDIISFKKECKLNEMFNIVILDSYTKPLDESFQRAFKLAQQFYANILNLEKRLLEKYSDCEGLKEYILIGKLWLDSNLQWSLLTPRYEHSELFEAHAMTLP